jgi:hypothetical protein
MYVANLDPDFLLPFLVFSIPIIAIVGGITAGIVKTLSQQRLIELAQRERIAAIERGLDPTKLPALPTAAGLGSELLYATPYEAAKSRSQWLTVAGVISIAVGIGLGIFLRIMEEHDNAWAVGIIPSAIGVALLLSAWIVRPTDADRRTPTA